MLFPKRNIVPHFRYLSGFATGQLLLQFFNILNGFFLLRWLTITEQAKFSVAFSLQSLILSLSDLGFTGSIIALVGHRINDKKIVGAYIQTSKQLRNYLFVCSCLISLLILPFIIREQHWNYIEICLIMTPVLLAVFWQANCSLYDSTLVMHKKMKELYAPQVSVAVLRFLSNFLLHLTGIIGAFSTLALNALSYFFTGGYFKRKAVPYIDISTKKDPLVFKEMISYLKPLFPSLIFNAFYSQIQIFLISFFGKSSNIAEIAALGKLSQLFLFLASFNGIVIAPFIAKSEQKDLPKKYFTILLLSGLVAASIFLSSLMVPGLFLFLLGPKYYHLKNELPIMILNACLTYISGVMWTMHSVRKWIFWWGTWSYMICIIVCQVTGMFIFDISSTHGVLAISTLTIAAVFLIHCFTCLVGFRQAKTDFTGAIQF